VKYRDPKEESNLFSMVDNQTEVIGAINPKENNLNIVHDVKSPRNMNPYTLNWKNNTFHLTFLGQIVLDNLMAANDALTSDSRLDSTKSYIVDFRYVTKFSVSARELWIYAHYDSVMPKFLRYNNIRGAYLTTSSCISQGLHEFLNEGHNAWERKIFCSDCAAVEWLQCAKMPRKNG
jgi:hypothetical protein